MNKEAVPIIFPLKPDKQYIFRYFSKAQLSDFFIESSINSPNYF